MLGFGFESVRSRRLLPGLWPVSPGTEALSMNGSHPGGSSSRHATFVNVPFLELKPAYDELRPELDAAYHRVMDSGRYLLGREIEAFEAEFAAYCEAKHCIGVANGLDALHLILRAWEIGPGHEVIVPSNTFIATWLAVSHAGAAPVPVEPGPQTYNLDPN